MVAGLTCTTAVRAVLDDVAVLGPAFTLASDPDEHLVPLDRLLTEPGVLRGQVDAAAAALGSNEDRVAASWIFGGMAARLVAPVLTAAAVHGALPVLTGADLRWRCADSPGGASWWLAAPRLVPWRDPDEVHGEIVGPLAGLASALLATVTVSERLLWGEVAAAVAKVARIVATARPAAAGARDPPARAAATARHAHRLRPCDVLPGLPRARRPGVCRLSAGAAPRRRGGARAHDSPTAGRNSLMNGLTLYTSAGCGFCDRLTGRLDKAGVPYEQVDVDGDAEAARWVEEVNEGPRTVPVVVYPDGSVVTNPEPRDVLAAVGH